MKKVLVVLSILTLIGCFSVQVFAEETSTSCTSIHDGPRDSNPAPKLMPVATFKNLLSEATQQAPAPTPTPKPSCSLGVRG